MTSPSTADCKAERSTAKIVLVVLGATCFLVLVVTIQVPAAVRLATVGRLPQARCPAGLVNPCRGSPGWSGSAATGWTPRPAARAGRRTGRGAQRGRAGHSCGRSPVGADRE